MTRLTRPFRRLRGKLTLSYTVTSVVTFLCLEVLAIAVVFGIATLNVPNLVGHYLEQVAPQAAPYYTQGAADRTAVTTWLNILNATVPNQWPMNFDRPLFYAVTDARGLTIASAGARAVPANTPLQAQLSPRADANLRAVLAASGGTTSKVGAESDNSLTAISPIVGTGGSVEGALVMSIAQPDRLQLLGDFLLLIVVTVTIVTTIAAIAGMIFGYLTARGLTRRLAGLSAAADRWSRGDFSALAHDASDDELGQVARQLNRMAEQLQNLLEARQKLATLEERNRLARDLHDSVKQQIFAMAMQVGATKALLRRDVDAAELRLNEADKLVRQAQQELTSLIRELRPVALEGKGLVVALRELATQWAEQTALVANLRTEGTHPLPLAVEEALYRVAQEALANVTRHSKATLVQLLLTTTDDAVALSVSDNGQGFDATRQGRLGVGLLSMRERMKALGGDVQVESIPGQGARIVARCPRSGAVASETPAAPRAEDAAGVTPLAGVGL